MNMQNPEELPLHCQHTTVQSDEAYIFLKIFRTTVTKVDMISMKV